jgi:hypothetical protein
MEKVLALEQLPVSQVHVIPHGHDGAASLLVRARRNLVVHECIIARRGGEWKDSQPPENAGMDDQAGVAQRPAAANGVYSSNVTLLNL